MKLHFHDAISNNRLMTLENTNFKTDFNDLSYNLSLDGIGSMRFKVYDYEKYFMVGLLSYVYLEDEGEILWGGVVMKTNNTEQAVSYECLEMKYVLTYIHLQDDKQYSGNGENIVRSVLEDYKQFRDIPVTMSDRSIVFENASVIGVRGTTYYNVITNVVNILNLRWGMEYEMDGTSIHSKLVIRSAFGLGKEDGIGLDRQIFTTLEQTLSNVPLNEEDGVLLYKDKTRGRGNIISYEFIQDGRGISTSAIVNARIGGQNQKFVSAQDSSNYELAEEDPRLQFAFQFISILQGMYGTKTSYINNVEVGDNFSGQRLADMNIAFPIIDIKLTVDETVPRLNINDRISFFINTPTLVIQASTGTELLSRAIGIRIEGIEAVLSDGKLLYTYRGTQGRTSKPISILSEIQKNGEKSKPILTTFTSS